MIAPIKHSTQSMPAWHPGFLAMLPKIVRHARVRLRHLKPELRHDALQEVAANATVAYARLAELGKADLAYPTVLANYAVAQFNDGRRVGSRLNVREILSEYAQRRKHFTVERLDRFDEADGEWKEAVVQDTRSAPVPDIVCFRIDFPAWLGKLSRRDRRIAKMLAAGYSTGEVAKRFNVSSGRVSQLRNEFARSWSEFHGEATQSA